MQIMRGNKYEITMFQWYETLAKAEKRLSESTECNKRFGDHEEWVKQDTEKLNKIKNDILEVQNKLEEMGVNIDYNKIKNSIKI